jgi:hypothetical protein
MAMVLRQALPLLATIWAETEAILVAERIDGKAQNNRIQDRNFEIDLLALYKENLIFIEVILFFLLLLRFTTLIVSCFIAIELLNLAIDCLLDRIEAADALALGNCIDICRNEDSLSHRFAANIELNDLALGNCDKWNAYAKWRLNIDFILFHLPRATRKFMSIEKEGSFVCWLLRSHKSD